MSVTRSPQFEANVASLKADGRDFDESKMFACPFCGTPTFDHRWTSPFDALLPGVQCPGWSDKEFEDEETMEMNNGELFTVADIPELDAAFTAAWEGGS